MQKLQFVNPWLLQTGKVRHVDDDSAESYKHSLAIYGDQWVWKNQKVEYSLNSQGYRCAEFRDIDWSQSVVIFGSSDVFGTGLDDSQTLSSRLSKKLSIPVINMGLSGSSMAVTLSNFLCLLENYPQPRYVINLWTSVNRLPYWDAGYAWHLGPWQNSLDLNLNKKLDGLFMAWNQGNENAQQWAKIFRSASTEILNSRRISHYEASMFQHTSDLFGIPFYDRQDFSRDQQHPGPKTIEFVATEISKNILI